MQDGEYICLMCIMRADIADLPEFQHITDNMKMQKTLLLLHNDVARQVAYKYVFWFHDANTITHLFQIGAEAGKKVEETATT